MDKSQKVGVVLILISSVILLFGGCTRAGVHFFNTWEYELRKEDDRTNYETRKKVEDSCRAMIASYNSDQLMYEQYKDSSNLEEHSWANNAKIRANHTATNYNEYILKNSFVWEENIPSDICAELPIIE